MAKNIKKSYNRAFKDEKTWAGSYIVVGGYIVTSFLIKLSGIIF